MDLKAFGTLIKKQKQVNLNRDRGVLTPSFTVEYLRVINDNII